MVAYWSSMDHVTHWFTKEEPRVYEGLGHLLGDMWKSKSNPVLLPSCLFIWDSHSHLNSLGPPSFWVVSILEYNPRASLASQGYQETCFPFPDLKRCL